MRKSPSESNYFGLTQFIKQFFRLQLKAILTLVMNRAVVQLVSEMFNRFEENLRVGLYCRSNKKLSRYFHYIMDGTND